MTIVDLRPVRYIVLLVFLGFPHSAIAQDLSDHLWKDRVLLIYAENNTSELYLQQMDELLKDKEGLDERKLVLYSMTPSHVKKGWGDLEWEARNKSFGYFHNPKVEFEIILLGLDGSVKLRQNQLLTRKLLFAEIDSMPMRQNELRSREQ